MKKWSFPPFVLSALAALFFLSSSGFAADYQPKIALINFKRCVEQSKMGKREEASFEAMKKQMESVVEEKEKTLNDLAAKLNDPDQLDLMSPEAETEMKRKFRALSQELNQIQAQYYQTLNQTNFKIVQQISETVAKVAKKIAEEMKIDIVMNDETCFYASPTFDISDRIVKGLDELFDQELKQGSSNNSPK